MRNRSMLSFCVLILVLVEHTLGEKANGITSKKIYSLNPCFSGTYSRRVKIPNNMIQGVCLNPCFSGTYSRSATFTTYTISKYYACKFGIFFLFLTEKMYLLHCKDMKYSGK